MESELRQDFFISVTVSVVKNLGTKLAQAKEECQDARGLDTRTLLHICFYALLSSGTLGTARGWRSAAWAG